MDSSGLSLQLKNLVDQISVLSTDEKEISAERLRSYLPQGSTLPALYRDGGEKDNPSEREILYKVLFDLRKDVNDLKKMALEGGSLSKDDHYQGDHYANLEQLKPAGDQVVVNVNQARSDHEDSHQAQASVVSRPPDADTEGGHQERVSENDRHHQRPHSRS